VLQGSYADGQSAGQTRSVVHLVNKSAAAEPDGRIERILLDQGEGASEYIVQAQFVNTGNVDLEPSAAVQLLSGRGEVLRASLSSEVGPLLPLGKRAFSEAIDFAKVEPGYYVLRATIGEGTGFSKTGQLLVQVTEEATQAGQSAAKRVTVLEEGAEIELPEGESLPGTGENVNEAEAAPAQ
jgi:hypothetical protein